MKAKVFLTVICAFAAAGSLAALCVMAALIAAPARAADIPAATVPKEGEAQGESLTEINKKLTNPISSLWSIAFQQNNYILDTGAGQPHHWNSNLNFQPIAAYFLPDGWSIGYSGNILANWKADKAGDTWTVPLGLSVSKVLKPGKLPVRFALAGQYMVHHPDTFGQTWNIQFRMVPVITKLIKGNLFGE